MLSKLLSSITLRVTVFKTLWLLLEVSSAKLLEPWKLDFEGRWPLSTLEWRPITGEASKGSPIPHPPRGKWLADGEADRLKADFDFLLLKISKCLRNPIWMTNVIKIRKRDSLIGSDDYIKTVCMTLKRRECGKGRNLYNS
jgi:hypothetical protein